MVGPVAKREAVAHLRGVLEMSERRASSIVAADRKMIRYRSSRPPDTELGAGLRELANQRRRFGYRPQASPADDRRHVLPLLASVGASLLLPRHGCRRGAGKSRARDWITGRYPG